MNKNFIYILFLGLMGLLSACSTAEPTPSAEVSAETISKITAYGTSKGLTFTKTPESVFYIISTKNATGRAIYSACRRAEKDQLLEILHDKKKSELLGLSAAEIEARIKALEG